MTVHASTSRPLSHLDLEILKLEKGETIEWHSDEFETVAVLIEGDCTCTIGTETHTMKRKSVFADRACAVFFSPGTKIVITSASPTVMALCKAHASKSFPTVFVGPEHVTEEWRGKEGYRRRVFTIVNTETQTERIAVGETINEPAAWSSFPPHKHDTHEKHAGQTIEAPLQEIYYFRIQPETGFGFQRVYAKDGSFDETFTIQDGDVTHIPGGYHPVANMPGHSLYYLWMLAGDERRYIWNTDPAFRSLD